MESSLRAPIAKSKTGIVMARIVSKKDGPFSCICCDGEMVLKRGSLKRSHFAHKKAECKNGKNKGGGIESIEHEYAKQIMAYSLPKWLFISRCQECKKDHVPPKRVGTDNCENPYKSTLECRTTIDNQVFTLDVGIFCNDALVGGIEIRHTHAVPEQKRDLLQKTLDMYYEVNATRIIEAFENDCFVCIDEYTIPTCTSCIKQKEWKQKRKCEQCQQWFDLRSRETVMNKKQGDCGNIESTQFCFGFPSIHPGKYEYVCNDCYKVHLDRYETCQGCMYPNLKQNIENYHVCLYCNKQKKKWIDAANSFLESFVHSKKDNVTDTHSDSLCLALGLCDSCPTWIQASNCWIKKKIQEYIEQIVNTN